MDFNNNLLIYRRCTTCTRATRRKGGSEGGGGALFYLYCTGMIPKYSKVGTLLKDVFPILLGVGTVESERECIVL